MRLFKIKKCLSLFIFINLISNIQSQTQPNKLVIRPHPSLSSIFAGLYAAESDFRNLKNDDDLVMPFEITRSIVLEAVALRGAESGEIADLFRQHAPLWALIISEEQEAKRFYAAFDKMDANADWEGLTAFFIANVFAKYGDVERKSPSWAKLPFVKKQRALAIFAAWIAAHHEAENSKSMKLLTNNRAVIRNLLANFDLSALGERVKFVEEAMRGTGSWAKFLEWLGAQ